MLGSHRKRRRRRRRERCVHERRERRSADVAWRQPSWWSVVEVDVPFVRRRVRLACFRQKGFARIAWSLPGDTGNARRAAAQGHGWRCSRGRRTPRRDRGGSRPRVRREGRNVHAYAFASCWYRRSDRPKPDNPAPLGRPCRSRPLMTSFGRRVQKVGRSCCSPGTMPAADCREDGRARLPTFDLTLALLPRGHRFQLAISTPPSRLTAPSRLRRRPRLSDTGGPRASSPT